MTNRTAALLLGALALLPLFGDALPTRRLTSPARLDAADRPFGIAKRVSWTTSRVTGSPEPPHPFAIERAFPKLQFNNPLLMARTGARFFVGEHHGKVFTFPDDQKTAKADLFLDVATQLTWDRSKYKDLDALYGLAFHPDFAKNRYCYVCYVLNSVKDGEQAPEGSRVSRFTVSDTDPLRADPKSEKVLITWLGGGHNGGDLHFGKDGMLYISTGDGWFPNPPDKRDTGQDISDLLSSVLRIDVDHADSGLAYAVPPDNPFVKTPGARPEVWAYGFRNPWRMSFDRATGDLWVGDVGWELWEMIYRVKKGGNYGWSVMEGPQSVRPEARRGPTPISPPNLAFPHTEAASITGGYVYRGERLKDLQGAYLCGDWVTRKLWATKFDGDKVVWHKEIAQGTQRVVAFGEARDGEVYFLDYDDAGKIYRLVPNPAAAEKQPDFPRKLSETGLFASVKDHAVAPGVVPFDVNAGQWADHATAERFLALPGTSTVKMYDSAVSIPGGFFSGTVFFPKDGVLARTVSIEMERGRPESRRRLETQLLHFDGTAWHGYTYAWNDDQTDAVLVPAAGSDRPLTVIDAKAPGGKRQQTWHYPSRAECMTCHNPWAGHTLAFTLPQLDREHDYGGARDNQVRALQHAGLIELLHNSDDEDGDRFHMPPRLTNPQDQSAKLDDRARSYLHANCAHCHRFGAGGSVDLELKYDTPLDRMKVLEVRPVQGTFEMPNALILAPGDPYRSVLYYRMAKLGRGRMPHVGSELVDEQGTRLIHDWIRRLPVRRDERLLVERLRELDEPSVLSREKADWDRNVQRTARWLAKEKGREKPSEDDRRAAEADLRKRAEAAAKDRAAERVRTIDQLLASTSSAFLLADALGEDRVPTSVRAQVVAAAQKLTDSQVRDLFERFVPDEQRVKRLGSVIKPEQILSLKGSAERGRELFFKSAGLQCVNCHRVGGTGATLGPDLSQIGKKATRGQILESLLEPSKSIEPAYVAYLLETTDGKFYTGLLASKSDKEVVLKVVGDKEVRVPAAKVERLAPQAKSLMPELLLRDLTAEQAADLLEFLSGLK
jgi:putative heme-binding domain-containing protein